MKNEKIIFLLACLFLFSGCCTRGGIHNLGDGADKVRDNLSKLGDEQTSAAITNTELEGKIEQSGELASELEKSITDGAGSIEEFKKILQRIRERGAGGTKQNDGRQSQKGIEN
ncbi:hypothetical protein [Treponema phagedenis]|uniref:Lipoprotein n=2 Tax=Treponema phagedenis TaxID=162 RepID=A0AAE6IU59_TREPH|nr:hypothetical protein [Treponema phagedenis]QEJ97976.1 hypothetical protein FUT82_08175 [Treponema phagedenis]QKS92424.1 hypothetical protein HPJ96_07640 [Treponema phagedenis]QKS92550.1 hypothetical protein HPJ96_08335 [Treponema phagedenis]